MDQKGSCQTLSQFEIIPFPLEDRARSLLGFSVKSVKKSRNFKFNAQKPSILPHSCPTCWDITESLLFLPGGAINRSSQVKELLHTLVIGP
jgi:hypothetical protein